MKVAFVSSHEKAESFLDDASFRYRCENLAFALKAVGFSCKLDHIESFSASSDLTHVVFHRPKISIRLRRLLKRLQQLNIIAIADFDDLVFDEQYADFSPAVLNNRLPRKKVVRKFKSNKEALEYFDHITVSTDSLAKQARRSFPNATIVVLKNAMHYKWPYKQPLPIESRKKVITYFPGTRSHDRDFLQVSEPLEYFLNEHPDTFFLVIGPLASTLLDKPNKQIRHIDKLPFSNYMQAARNSWINLLPLEPTPFNFCKSAVKIIEAGSYIAPTIASPLPDALRFEGIGASIAIDDDQWLKSLEALYDTKNYKQTTARIEKHFAKASDSKVMAVDFYNAFNAL
jgi:hypothetical protein